VLKNSACFSECDATESEQATATEEVIKGQTKESAIDQAAPDSQEWPKEFILDLDALDEPVYSKKCHPNLENLPALIFLPKTQYDPSNILKPPTVQVEHVERIGW
jgi:hypothetical protein